MRLWTRIGLVIMTVSSALSSGCALYDGVKSGVNSGVSSAMSDFIKTIAAAVINGVFG